MVLFYFFVMYISPYWYKWQAHSQNSVLEESFSEIYDTIASKENLSTSKFVKLLDVLLRWDDINKKLEVLQTPHTTALVLPYCKQNT